MGITIFFVLTVICLLVFTLANVNWSVGTVSVHIPTGLKIPDPSSFVSKSVIQGFLFFDVVLGLFLFDSYLRNKKVSKQV
jgi:hypothetical protein